MGLPLCLAALETCWLYPWSLLLGYWFAPTGRAPLLSTPSVAALALLGWAAMRGARRLSWPLPRLRLLVVGSGVVAAGTAALLEHGAETGLAAGFFGLFLWWRAVRRGQDALGPDQIEDTFKLGLAGLVGFLAVASATEGGRYLALQAAVAAYVLGFFFVGLVSLALARLAAQRDQSRARHGSAPAYNRQWLGTLVAVVVGLLLVAVLVAQIVTVDLIGALWRPIGALLSDILYVLILTIAIPLALLLELLVNLARSLMGRPQPLVQQQPNGLMELTWRIARREPFVLPPEVERAANVLAILLVAAAALVLLARAVRWWRERERDDEVEEERDSVWSWSSARAALIAWLRGLRARLRRRERPTDGGAAGSATPALGAGSPSAATVRQIYGRALALAASLGHKRAAWATPYEHLPGLQAGLDPDEDVSCITDAYVRARYGASPPPEDDVRRVRESWARVEAASGASTGGAG